MLGDQAIHVALLGGEDVAVGMRVALNALHKSGFRGTAWIGVREAVGSWQVLARDSCVDMRIVPLTTSRNLAYAKAEFVNEILDDLAPTAESVAYFDADTVVHRPWAYFRAWCGQGIALCEDFPHTRMLAPHPRTEAWRALLAQEGLALTREPQAYFNGGFVGVPRSAMTFRQTWARLCDQLEASPALWGESQHFAPAGPMTRAATVLAPAMIEIMRPDFLHDQDALNIAVAACDDPLSVLGPHAMGFDRSWNIVVGHAAGPHKPWAKHYVRESIFGRGPTPTDRIWWQHTAGPLRAMTPWRARTGRARLRFAKAISAVTSHRS